MVENITPTLYNFENINISVPQYRDMPIQYVTETHHAISFGEIVFVAALFIFMAYWLIKVSRNKEYYEHWKNPNGREVNLYKKVRLLFWLYTAAVIILGLIQSYLSMRVG